MKSEGFWSWKSSYWSYSLLQECDVEKVSVAGAEDACRVAAEVMQCHVYHQYDVYQRHQYQYHQQR